MSLALSLNGTVRSVTGFILSFLVRAWAETLINDQWPCTFSTDPTYRPKVALRPVLRHEFDQHLVSPGDLSPPLRRVRFPISP
jgi:hypothetical protein